MWQAINEQLSANLGSPFDITDKLKLDNQGFDEQYIISNEQDRYLIKISHKEHLPIYEAEIRSLLLLSESQAFIVPQPILSNTTKNHAFLILDYLAIKPLSEPEAQYKFGQQLARLHQWGEQKEFGLDEDNYLGHILQPNPWHKKWPLFFAEQRIGWQLQLLKEKGLYFCDIDELVEVAKHLLAGHTPKPSLLHGALWFNNIAQSVNGAICSNPASYWGDHECDIAMAELSGGFLTEFYQGYQALSPLSHQYHNRKALYQLYHQLNLCNQFGGHYLEQVDLAIKNLLAY